MSRPSGIHQTCVCNRSHGSCKSKEPEEHWTESVNAFRTKSIRQTRICNRSYSSWRSSEITWAALGNLVHIAYRTVMGQHQNAALYTGRTGQRCPHGCSSLKQVRQSKFLTKDYINKYKAKRKKETNDQLLQGGRGGGGWRTEGRCRAWSCSVRTCSSTRATLITSRRSSSA